MLISCDKLDEDKKNIKNNNIRKKMGFIYIYNKIICS